MQVKKQQLELDVEQWTGSKLWKEYIKAVLSPCLFNFYVEYIMRNAWLAEFQAIIKIVGRNINNLRYEDDTTLIAESEEELKSLLMKVKEESEKAGFKLSIQKAKIIAYSPIFHGKQMGKKWRQWQILFSWAPKSLWFVTTTMKLKDACSLEVKQWQTYMVC